MAAGKKYPLTELQRIMEDVRTQARWAGALVHLFVSDITPATGDSVGTYSGSEAAWSGYGAQSASYGAAANDGTHGYTDSAVLAFTVTSGGTGTTVYGYYITDSTSTDLIFAERIVTPISVIDGFPVPLQVRMRDANA